MSQRHPEDAPWNDVAADSDTMGANPEPDPADVVTDEDDDEARDLDDHPVPDVYAKYQQESLDQRLSEEEPEMTLGPDPAAEAGELQSPDDEGDDDIDAARAEADPDALHEAEDEPDAEDAAVHVRRRV